jgi:hypothetical protein
MEPQAQHLFHLCVLAVCMRMDIDLSPESDAGRGSVDFKFSKGWNDRALVKLKLAMSSSFTNNLAMQPPTYMNAEGIDCAYMLVIQYEDKHCTNQFMNNALSVVEAYSAQTGKIYKAIIVDARKKPSASKLKPPESI